MQCHLTTKKKKMLVSLQLDFNVPSTAHSQRKTKEKYDYDDDDDGIMTCHDDGECGDNNDDGEDDR